MNDQPPDKLVINKEEPTINVLEIRWMIIYKESKLNV